MLQDELDGILTQCLVEGNTHIAHAVAGLQDKSGRWQHRVVSTE
jgi:hypothetical protein